MRDIANNISPVTSIAPAVLTATASGAAVDLLGFNAAAVVISTGAIAGSGNFTPKLQEKFEEPHLHKTVLISVVCSVFWPITLPIYGLYKVYRKYRPSK